MQPQMQICEEAKQIAYESLNGLFSIGSLHSGDYDISRPRRLRPLVIFPWRTTTSFGF
jgi:hypothetical protein